MAHGFLTPQAVSGDRFWQNPKDLYNLYKRIKDLLSKKQGGPQEKGGGLATTQKGGIVDENLKAVRVSDVTAPKAQRNTPPAARMLRQSSVAGALGAGTDAIVKKEQLALPPGGPRLPGGASPTKGGTFTNIPGIAAAPKKLDSEAFFKAAQTGVDPETGRYLSSDERKAFLKKSKSQLNATASVASAAAPGISSASSLMTKGDEAVVGSVDNLTNVVSSLVDAVKAQTASDKQIAQNAKSSAEKIANRSLARDEEKALEAGTDNSGFITPTGGLGSLTGGGSSGGGGGGLGLGTALGAAGKIIGKAAPGIGARGAARALPRAGAAIAGKAGAKSLMKLGGKTAARMIPGAQTAIGLGLAGEALSRGDILGAALSAGSAIPGPIGWGFLAADVARDVSGGGSEGKGMARGGLVTGGKKSVVDDVPIRADEGEVVMSNAAGNAWGRGTLLAMNAMGGGSNNPTGGKAYNEGGLVGGDKAKSKQMFKLFGEGMIDAQKANSRDFARIQSQGLRQYYENEGGGERLGKNLASVWGKIGGVLGGLFSGTLTSLLGGTAQAAPFGNPADYLSGDTSSLASFIGGVESGNDYTKLVGGKTDANILNKTVSELNAEKGGQFAMGRYQIQMRTAIGALKKAGIDPSKFKFDQAGQDKLFQLLLEGRGYKDFMSGKISKEQFATNLSMEWAALPKDASGKSFYAGVGNNKAHRGWGDTLQQLETLKASGNPMGPPGSVGSTGSSALAAAAVALKGKSTKDGPDGGRNGCVYAVNKVYKQAGITPPWGSSVYVPDAESKMQKSGYQQVSYASRRPGDIMVMYDKKSPPQAHIGVVLGNGNVLSNSSGKASFSWEASPEEYNKYYGGQGKIYRMPGGTSASTIAKNNGDASSSKAPTQPLSTNGNIAGGGQGGGRGSRATARRTASTPTPAPSPTTAPSTRTTGNDLAQASAFYTSSMRNTRGGGTTIINNNNNQSGGGAQVASAGPSGGSSSTGLSALALRIQS